MTKVIENGPMPEQQAKLVIRQLLHAVEYMHSQNVIHGDINPDSILFQSRRHQKDMRIKLTGFGKAIRVMNSGYDASELIMNSIFDLPPKFEESKEFNEKIDIWAIG